MALLAILPGIAEAAPCAKYGPRTVTGTIHRVMYFGPPNFGENPNTDQRGFYPVLKLDKPPHMCAKDPDGFAKGPVTAREMQMIFTTPRFDKSWYDKHVSVRGDLFAAETGGHHTPVMLMVKQLQAAP